MSSTTSTSTTTSNEQKYLEAANGKLKFMDGGIRTTNERNKTRFTSSSEEEDSEEEEEQGVITPYSCRQGGIALRWVQNRRQPKFLKIPY